MSKTNIKTKSKYLKVFIIAIFSFLSLVSWVDAATLSFSPSSPSLSVGNIVSVKVITNTQGKSINNAEANIQFPTDLLEVVSVSKTSSIFSLWVEEPSFSNSAGSITLNGGVPNPGFTGTSGSILSIVFKAKKPGTASVVFASGAVRENDGMGTDILTSTAPALITIEAVKIVEQPSIEVEENTLSIDNKDVAVPKPVIVSDTHPNQDLWYSLDTASFSWKIPSGVVSLRTLFNKVATATPTITYDNSVSQKTLSNLNDGTYYFHLRYSNGLEWGPIAHYKVKLDSTPPLPFSLSVRNKNQKNLIKLGTTDKTSGIDYYTLNIDDRKVIKIDTKEIINGEYVMPVVKEGNHKAIVRAYDKAKNFREDSLDFLSYKISAPQVFLNSKEIIKGESITISGKTEFPNEQVEITISNSESGSIPAIAGFDVFGDDETKKYTQKSSEDGAFSVTTDALKSTGLMHVTAQVVFPDDVRSEPSDVVYLEVKNSKVVNTTLSVLYPLLGVTLIVFALALLLCVIYFGWHHFCGLRKRISRELQDTAKEVHKAMLLLKEELNDQLVTLKKAKEDRALNKKEEAIFNDIQKNIDDIDRFIEKKLKKLI